MRTMLQRGIVVLGLAAMAALTGLPRALAHGPEAKVEREVIRLQGYRDVAPESGGVVAEITLNVFGAEHRFHVTDWRLLSLSEEARVGKPDAHLALQGDRGTLSRIEDAKPGQRITILAERRLGSSDLFVVALDLCPEK